MKNFVLVWLQGSKPFPIKTGAIQICQAEKKRLKDQPQYHGGKLLIRSEAGLLAHPSYTGKPKKI